jgi:hypothetical protein
MASSKSSLPALLSTILFVVISSSVCRAEEVKVVQAEGVATVMRGNVALARDAAIEDALRRSVEETVGTMVESHTLVENFQLVSDRIYSQSHGYIKRYRILKEEEADQVLRVRVEAAVATGHLKDDLSALHLLIARVHKPRMMILIEETVSGASRQVLPSSDPSQVENILARRFMDKGFYLVDRAQVRKKLNRDQVSSLIEEDEKGARALGSGYGAEVIILGKAGARPLPIKDLKALNLSGMKSCQAQVTVKAFRADTGEMLASASETAAAVHIDETAAESEALKNAGEKLAPLLIDQITAQWGRETGGTALVQLLISGLTFREFAKFKEILKSEIRGVNGIHQRSFEGKVARIDVDFVGDVQNLADDLAVKDFGTFRVEIIGFSPHKIDLKVAP